MLQNRRQSITAIKIISIIFNLLILDRNSAPAVANYRSTLLHQRYENELGIKWKSATAGYFWRWQVMDVGSDDAAIGADVLSSDPGGFCTDQKQHYTGDIQRLTDTAEHSHVSHAFDLFRALARGKHFGVHWSG